MGFAAHTVDAVRRNALAQTFSQSLAQYFPGVGLCALIAGLALGLSQMSWLQSRGIGALVIAMLVGAGFGNLFQRHIGPRYLPGIALCKQTLLRLGILLYGFHLTLDDIAMIGLPGVLVDAAMLISTFLLSLLIGIRLLNMETGTVVLIGAGSAICGAAAVLATEPVVQARSDQVTVAVSTVVLFGTLATFLYPVLYHLNLDWQLLPLSSSAFGLYMGSTIHEVAQVVAAARLIDADAADSAVIAKMVRVMMLPAFLIALSMFLIHAARRTRSDAMKPTPEQHKLAVPWFAVGFLIVVALNSSVTLPAVVSERVLAFDMLMLTMAMAALGLSTHVSAFKRAGFRPILLAGFLFVWLVGGGAWINWLAIPQ